MQSGTERAKICGVARSRLIDFKFGKVRLLKYSQGTVDRAEYVPFDRVHQENGRVIFGVFVFGNQIFGDYVFVK